MFSNLPLPDWNISTTYIQTDPASEKSLPRKTLKSYTTGIQISIQPYRMIFEPGIPCDDYCKIDIELNDDMLTDLINAIDTQAIKIETSDKKISCILEKKTHVLMKYLNTIHDFLMLTSNKNLELMQNGFNALRQFLSLPIKGTPATTPCLPTLNGDNLPPKISYKSKNQITYNITTDQALQPDLSVAKDIFNLSF